MKELLFLFLIFVLIVLGHATQAQADALHSGDSFGDRAREKPALKHVKVVDPLDSAQSFDDIVRKELVWKHNKIAGVLSDIGQISLVVAPFVYAVKQPDKWKRIAVTGTAFFANTGMTQLVQKIIGRTRPDKSDNNSFFSGHTSTAFTGAGLLCLQAERWMCASGLGVAAMTGYLRIAADKHWLSDVVVGAGVGFVNGRLMPTINASF